MPVVTVSRLRNLTFWLTIVGLLLVAGSLWMPVATAERTARVEGRADRLAALLLATASEMQPLHGGDPLEVEVLYARFVALAMAAGERVEDLERLVDPASTTWVLLQNRHYHLQLTESPPDPRDAPGAGTVPAIEVLAWPRAQGGPARTVFFHPETAEAAYSRNLVAGYHGVLDRRPRPGRSHRRPAGVIDPAFSYRSYDDERWLLSQRPAGWSRARLRASGS